MREKLLITFASIATFFCLLFAGIVMLALFWKYQPADEPYTILHPAAHVAEYVDGNLVAVTRQFLINKKVELVVERELIQAKPSGVVVRVELPETRAHYDPGTYSTQRIFEIPDGLPTGVYELQNRVCWNQNPIRKNCVDLPKLSFKYVNK